MRLIVAQLDIEPEARGTFVSYIYMATYIDKTRAEHGNVGSDLKQSSRFTMVEQ